MAAILYILTVAASKGSALFFIKRLVASKLHRTAISALSVILAIWAIATVLTTALRCGLPHPWTKSEGECLSMVSVSWSSRVYPELMVKIGTSLRCLRDCRHHNRHRSGSPSHSPSVGPSHATPRKGNSEPGVRLPPKVSPIAILARSNHKLTQVSIVQSQPRSRECV